MQKPLLRIFICFHVIIFSSPAHSLSDWANNRARGFEVQAKQIHEKEALQKRQKHHIHQCFTCNTGRGIDDTQSCVDQVETCSIGVQSCSTVIYYTNDARNVSGRVKHIRKFCTSPGTVLYDQVMNSSQTSLCQNINTRTTLESSTASSTRLPTVPDNTFNIEPEVSTNLHMQAGPPSLQPPPHKLDVDSLKARVKRQTATRRSKLERGPPAPPNAILSSIVCACRESLCNSGNTDDVINRSALLGDVGTSMRA